MTRGIVPAESHSWLAAAALAWATALAVTGWTVGWVVAGAAVAFLCVRGRPGPALAVVVVAGSAWITPAEPALPEGPITGHLTLSTAPTAGPYGMWAIGKVGGSEVFADLPVIVAGPGEVIAIEGTVTPASTTIGGRLRQIVEVSDAVVVGGTHGIYTAAGAAVRRIVSTTLSGGSEARSLLAGFLVGDVSGVGPVTIEEMRAAGLSHFVAVSGSNVAMFLGLVSILALPFGIRPGRRALAGLVSLPVFVVATGFEPSVLRAAAMSGVVLVGRLFGFAIEVWQVIATATVAVLVYEPQLAHSVGLQLSLVATCGVVAGSRWPGTASLPMRMLRVAMGAQLAVAPLLLLHFGTVPLLGPLSNLLAAPVVALATALGMVGVAGFRPALVLAEWLAGIVIDIARIAAGWPQVNWIGFLAAVAVLPLVARVPRHLKAPALLAGAAVLLLILSPHTRPLDPGEVVVLDIGQGDAILVSGGDGHFALVDGGRDPALLISRLRDYGIRYLDLVVMTHGDADHAGGLGGLPGRVGIGQVWERIEPHRTAAAENFVGLATALGIPIRHPEAGTRLAFGEIEVEVLAPSRRYEKSNDQSIVLLLVGEAWSMLLTGDIEVAAQIDLPDLDVDVLKVPHHGAGTSDRSWIGSTGATQAVISVGENDFGHPVGWVLDALLDSGATIRRTDLEGDVAYDLGG